MDQEVTEPAQVTKADQGAEPIPHGTSSTDVPQEGGYVRTKFGKLARALHGFLAKNVLNISLFALIVSSAGLGINCYNTIIQNRRWRVLNAPRLRITTKVLPVKEISEDELLRMNTNKEWYSGYVPLVYPQREEGLYTGKYVIASELVFWRDNDPLLDVTKGMQTPADVAVEAQRLGIVKINLYRRYCFRITLTNEGPGAATDIVLNQTPSVVPVSFGIMDARDLTVDLRSNDSTHWDRIIDSRLDGGTPEAFTFEISGHYSFDGVVSNIGPYRTTYNLRSNRWDIDSNSPYRNYP
jgi:hypothetical protein